MRSTRDHRPIDRNTRTLTPFSPTQSHPNTQVNLLATGSWDKTLRYWDTRSPTPALQVQLPDRCYALSCTHPLLVVGTAERHIQVYDLNNPSAPFKQLQSPLKYQTRTVAAFPDKSGYLVGSIEGRVAVQHVDDGEFIFISVWAM